MGPIDPMSFEIEFASSAARRFFKLTAETQRRLQPKIDALADEPRPPRCEKLSGANAYRVRVGDYRIVYEIDDADERITIALIDDRKDIYRRLD